MIARRVRSLLGADAVVATDVPGPPLVAPGREEALALLLRTATAEGWRVRIAGGATWMPDDAPCDIAVTTRALSALRHVNAADLVATAEAGVTWEALRQHLAEHGAWIAADPPGGERTLGSVVATGTAGPLRTGFGGIRDHLLGVTLVTGDGRVIHAGGRVVKNVAGFELTKLATGSFGAFGIVTAAHLRLRAVPRADVTLVADGPRDALLQGGRTVLERGVTPAALELLSPTARGRDDDAWRLAVRLIGGEPSVQAQRDAVSGTFGARLEALAAGDAAAWWRGVLAAAALPPTTLRVGALPGELDDALDLVAHHLPEGWLSVTVSCGTVRWSGAAPSDRIRLLRHAAAQREMPMTLERAPWNVRAACGHFGAYREGVSRLVSRLRSAFDPAGVLVAPIGD